jgi:hypothetical protein
MIKRKEYKCNGKENQQITKINKRGRKEQIINKVTRKQ